MFEGDGDQLLGTPHPVGIHQIGLDPGIVVVVGDEATGHVEHLTDGDVVSIRDRRLIGADRIIKVDLP